MDNTGSLDQTLTIDLEAVSRVLKMYSEYIEQIMESIKPILQKIYEAISQLIEYINSLMKELIRAYSLSELSIPETSVSINGYDDQSQAPPNDKSIKEIAIENLSYNINKYRNSKIFQFIQKKAQTLFELLVLEYLKELIFKALGMH